MKRKFLWVAPECRGFNGYGLAGSRSSAMFVATTEVFALKNPPRSILLTSLAGHFAHGHQKTRNFFTETCSWLTLRTASFFMYLIHSIYFAYATTWVISDSHVQIHVLKVLEWIRIPGQYLWKIHFFELLFSVKVSMDMNSLWFNPYAFVATKGEFECKNHPHFAHGYHSGCL